MSEHIILVAFEVEAEDRAAAHAELREYLPKAPLWWSWWVAEDDRQDGSDRDSAVFVPRGAQEHMESIIDMYFEAHADEWSEDGYPFAKTDVSGAWFRG